MMLQASEKLKLAKEAAERKNCSRRREREHVCVCVGEGRGCTSTVRKTWFIG